MKFKIHSDNVVSLNSDNNAFLGFMDHSKILSKIENVLAVTIQHVEIQCIYIWNLLNRFCWKFEIG